MIRKCILLWNVKFVTTGKYPLDIPNVPAMPAIKKDPKELGASAVDIDDNK